VAAARKEVVKGLAKVVGEKCVENRVDAAGRRIVMEKCFGLVGIL
jgi:hypothetical protein